MRTYRTGDRNPSLFDPVNQQPERNSLIYGLYMICLWSNTSIYPESIGLMSWAIFDL